MGSALIAGMFFAQPAAGKLRPYKEDEKMLHPSRIAFLATFNSEHNGDDQDVSCGARL